MPRFRRVLAVLLIAGVLMPALFVPSTQAPTHPGRFRSAAPAASPWLPAGQGEPFLTDVFGANARIIVWAAFGADIKGDPYGYGWQWFDITADVRQAEGQRVNITPVGRSDETSQAQPAGVAFQVDNTSGDYTANHPGSRWWPYVRRNTPIKVEVNLTGLIADSVIRFQGYANGWVPSWDISGNLAVVTVSASGILRRLNQGKTPLKSPLARAIPHRTPSPVAYWTLEDGSAATQAASGLAGGTPAVASGLTFASDSTLAGSAPLAVLKATGTFRGFVSHTFTQWQVDWYAKIPAAPADSTTVFMRINLAGAAVDRFDFIVGFDGAQNFNRVIGYLGSVVVSDSGEFVPSAPFDIWWHFYITATTSGGTTTWWFVQARDGDGAAGGPLGTYSGPAGSVTSVEIPQDAELAGVGLGHVAVTDTFLNLTDVYNQIFISSGFDGELATDRIARLCAEEGVPVQVTGTSTTTMGPQGVATLLSLLRECETTDDGLLYDGFGPGLGYITRQSRYNRPASIALDMAADPPQVDDPFEPKDDDQRNRNIVKVDRKNGSSVTFEDADSPLGTGEIQDYDTTVTVNTQTDDVLLPRAAWEVHKGTVTGFRYPSLNLDLAATPAVAAAWLATPLAGRADVANVTSKATQHPPGTVSNLVEGYAESLSPFDWEVHANCSPFEPWRVLVLEGDVVEFRWRVDSAASALHQDYPAGVTSIQVDVNDGYLWSTAPADYPRDLDVGGVKVTATACSGASSPQAVTVSSTAYRLLAGSRVKLWKPGVVAL